jgi:hypothetical protein
MGRVYRDTPGACLLLWRLCPACACGGCARGDCACGCCACKTVLPATTCVQHSVHVRHQPFTWHHLHTRRGCSGLHVACTCAGYHTSGRISRRTKYSRTVHGAVADLCHGRNAVSCISLYDAAACPGRLCVHMCDCRRAFLPWYCKLVCGVSYVIAAATGR